MLNCTLKLKFAEIKQFLLGVTFSNKARGRPACQWWQVHIRTYPYLSPHTQEYRQHRSTLCHALLHKTYSLPQQLYQLRENNACSCLFIWDHINLFPSELDSGVIPMGFLRKTSYYRMQKQHFSQWSVCFCAFIGWNCKVFYTWDKLLFSTSYTKHRRHLKSKCINAHRFPLFHRGWIPGSRMTED